MTIPNPFDPPTMRRPVRSGNLHSKGSPHSVELAAAVCAAGGLGSLGTAVRGRPELREQWARLRDRTDRPFAINHTVRPLDPDAFTATVGWFPA